ncbi:MAG: glutathione synthase, partial [Gammaproteobacteria bacterium]
TLTAFDTRTMMAQKFLPEYIEGDKRILLIDGKPVPYALARIPAAGETRANLATGGTGKGVELTARDRWICAQVAPRLVDMGLVFVGLDVIGDYLTEINVTSPTGMRELDSLFDIDIGAILMDAIERRL